MANYVGVHCPVCNNRFTDDDDVVVCPICGAPHHRACYHQLGHCALDDLHIKGQVWEHPEAKAAAEQTATSGGGLVCPSCGANNPQSGLFCQVCGTPLKSAGAQSPPPRSPFGGFAQQAGRQSAAPGVGSAPSAYTMAFGGVNPNEEIDGVAARDIALFVGESSHYFLPRFQQLSNRKPFSFNFAALFFNFFYFFFRKMFLIGGILLALTLASQIPALLAAQEYTAWVLANIEDISIGITPVFTPHNHLWVYNVIPVLRLVMFAISLLACLLANRLYMIHVLSSIRKIKAQFTSADGLYDDRLYSEKLAQKGHTSRKAAVLVLLSCVVLYFTFCFIMAWNLV